MFVGALVTPLGNDWIGAFDSLTAGNGWPLDNESLINMLRLKGLNEEISNTTDAGALAILKQNRTYSYIARALLIGLFTGISWLVYIAYRKRQHAELNAN